MRLGRAVLAFGLLLALLGVPLLIAPWYGGPDRPLRNVEVVIKPGSSLNAAAEKLDDADLISSARQFRYLARILGRPTSIKAGVYRLAVGDGWVHYLRKLQAGDVVSYRITIPEGWPSVLVADRLRAEKQLKGDVAVPAEGSVLPDT